VWNTLIQFLGCGRGLGGRRPCVTRSTWQRPGLGRSSFQDDWLRRASFARAATGLVVLGGRAMNGAIWGQREVGNQSEMLDAARFRGCQGRAYKTLFSILYTTTRWKRLAGQPSGCCVISRSISIQGTRCCKMHWTRLTFLAPFSRVFDTVHVFIHANV